MKKMILLSSILAAGALFADEVTTTTVASTEVGVMGISISTNANLIAVPFLGYTNDTITVADMVNTAQLDQGSKLYVPNASGTYDVWTLQENKTWEAGTQVNIAANGDTETSTGSAAANVRTDRGGAFWLDPANNEAVTIYLLGQPASDKGTSSATGNTWNLIGNASDASVDLKDLDGADFDQIVVQTDNGVSRYYIYNGTTKKWECQDSHGEWVSTNVPISVGKGLWYKPGSATTINWSTGKAAQ